jgi:hypothetical protein
VNRTRSGLPSQTGHDLIDGASGQEASKRSRLEQLAPPVRSAGRRPPAPQLVAGPCAAPRRAKPSPRPGKPPPYGPSPSPISLTPWAHSAPSGRPGTPRAPSRRRTARGRRGAETPGGSVRAASGRDHATPRAPTRRAAASIRARRVVDAADRAHQPRVNGHEPSAEPDAAEGAGEQRVAPTRAASQGSSVYAKRVVRRKVYGKSMGLTRSVLEALGLRK